MKDLTAVKKFYENVATMETMDYEKIAQTFQNHDIFANPPQFRQVSLPFLGEIDLGLVAVAPQGESNSFYHTKIAIDDGEYHYKSAILFVARPTSLLAAAGYCQVGLNGLIKLSCHQSAHSNLFGHPAKVFGGGRWPMRTTHEFCTDLLPRLIKNAVSRFYPSALHQYPFEDGEVMVFVKDVTKIGGYKMTSPHDEAREIFREQAEYIRSKEHGNAICRGYIQQGDVQYVIPAFGKNHNKGAFMTAIGLYFKMDKESVNALRTRLNALAHALGYYAERGPTAGQGNLASMFTAIDAGELALVLLPDEHYRPALQHLEALGEDWATSIAASLRDALQRQAKADEADIDEYLADSQDQPQQLDIHVSRLTLRQIDKISAREKMTPGEVITLAMDRLHHRRQTKTDVNEYE